jgi:hypothetical protein
MSDVWGVLIAPVNGCPRHREVSAAHSQRHGGLVTGLALGFEGGEDLKYGAKKCSSQDHDSTKMRQHIVL